MVCGQALRQATPRGPQGASLHQEEALPRRYLQGRDRANGRQARDQYSHGAAGDLDREARSRGRDSPQGSQAIHGRRHLHQHQGDSEGRTRCPAGRGEHRAAARAPGSVPARHEEGDDLDNEVRRRGHPHPVCRPPGRRRDGSPGVVSRWARALAHASSRDRIRLRRGQDDLRDHWREVLGQPEGRKRERCRQPRWSPTTPR